MLHAAGIPRPASWKAFRTAHIDGTRNVLVAARRVGVRRVVNIASQAVLFAGQDLLDIDETTAYPRRYIDPYSATKAAAERLALEHNDSALEVTSLRPGMVWGRGDTTCARRSPHVPSKITARATSWGIRPASDWRRG